MDCSTTSRLAKARQYEADEGYYAFERLIADRIAEAKNEPLFTTDAFPSSLWGGYLVKLPNYRRRQHYTCHCCRRFVEKYGGLVLLDERSGNPTSLLWTAPSDAFPPFFRDAAVWLSRQVEQANVTGVFVSSDEVWGEPKSKSGWTHLSGRNPNVYQDRLKTAQQRMAEMKQDFGVLNHSLADYPRSVAAQAVRVLEAEAVDRSDKAVGVARWFLELHAKVDGVKGRRRDNLLWLAVATSPTGYAHVRSTVISTLLDDLKAGLPFDAVKRRWAEKMNPLQYQRPTAAPKAGQIDQAERIVAQLGLEPAFRRKFATLDDVQVKVWEPTPDAPKAATGGVFSHLRTPPKATLRPVELPETPITWTKFERTVLPDATKVEYKTPWSNAPYYGLLTAVNADAPPLFQWDGLDGSPRNPVSWFFSNPSPTTAGVGLPRNQYVEVSAVFYPPWQWFGRFTHFDRMVFFAIVGCGAPTPHSLCLFPETLKTDLHGVRAVIEAHSRRGRVEGEPGDANGIAFQADRPTPLTVRVTTRSGPAVYKIDRWD